MKEAKMLTAVVGVARLGQMDVEDFEVLDELLVDWTTDYALSTSAAGHA